MFLQQAVSAQKPVKPAAPLFFDKGKLHYTPEPNGDRIPDFSYCGYMASEKPIPTVPVKIIVPLAKGDATSRIQAALDQLAAMPPDNNGIRGAVLLQKGNYEVNGQLRIKASGIVLRGSGVGLTTITGTGNGRLALIKIIGKNTISREATGMKIID
ncbi:MAG TPA: pectate lyase, partial [Chitinophagaceae bacterium]|nr:pectate lyase [Chitinophagaceae bacterium]